MTITLITAKGDYYAKITVGRCRHTRKSYIKVMGEIAYISGGVTDMLKKYCRGERKLPNRFYRKAESILHQKNIMEKIPHRLKNRGGESTLATIPTNKVQVYESMGAWVKVLGVENNISICKIGLYNYNLRY